MIIELIIFEIGMDTFKSKLNAVHYIGGVQSRWEHFNRVSGVLCDRRISLLVKGKVYNKEEITHFERNEFN